MTRTCRRNGCTRPATATLTFRYDTAQAWLRDLAAEAEPQCWDLCPVHGGKLTVPVGWELVDDRTEAGAGERPAGEAAEDPSGLGSVATARRRATTARRTAGTRPNRYAELSARLPELAAQMSVSSPLLDRDGATDADSR